MIDIPELYKLKRLFSQLKNKNKTKEQHKTCGSRISDTGPSNKLLAIIFLEMTPKAVVFLLELSSRNYKVISSCKSEIIAIPFSC